MKKAERVFYLRMIKRTSHTGRSVDMLIMWLQNHMIWKWALCIRKSERNRTFRQSHQMWLFLLSRVNLSYLQMLTTSV